AHPGGLVACGDVDSESAGQVDGDSAALLLCGNRMASGAVERLWPDGADRRMAAGSDHLLIPVPESAVHRLAAFDGRGHRLVMGSAANQDMEAGSLCRNLRI